MPAVTQAEFARLEGKARSYITALKKAGRLVMTADDLVDLEASRALIAATADPGRDDVAARHAAARGETPTPPEKHAANSADTEKLGNSYAAARAVKEKYAAMTAKMEYERASGKLIEREAVAAAVEDIMTTVRQHFEQQPHRVAPMLIGLDLDAIRAILKQETNGVLAEMVKEFGKRLRQIAGEEEGN